MAKADPDPLFLELYRDWHELYAGEIEDGAEDHEARSEALYARYAAAEAALLAFQPTSPVEIIGMLEVICSEEWTTPAQRAALRSIQGALAAERLKSITQASSPMPVDVLLGRRQAAG